MFEVGKGAVSKKECKELGRSYLFHVDREYMRDGGCLARVVVYGHTWDIYHAEPGSFRMPRPRAGTVAAFVAGVLVIPSPLYGTWWKTHIAEFCNLLLSGAV